MITRVTCLVHHCFSSFTIHACLTVMACNEGNYLATCIFNDPYSICECHLSSCQPVVALAATTLWICRHIVVLLSSIAFSSVRGTVVDIPAEIISAAYKSQHGPDMFIIRIKLSSYYGWKAASKCCCATKGLR